MEELKDKFKTHLFLKAIVDGKIVGSVRVAQKDGACYVGRLMVHPDFQNQGVATKLLYESERRFSNCSRFELFTGRRSEKNIRLYEKLGYKQFRNEQADDNLYLVYLEKVKQPQ
jgi:ribosomal protein S18 acetylase RimI-like enzyme